MALEIKTLASLTGGSSNVPATFALIGDAIKCGKTAASRGGKPSFQLPIYDCEVKEIRFITASTIFGAYASPYTKEERTNASRPTFRTGDTDVKIRSFAKTTTNAESVTLLTAYKRQEDGEDLSVATADGVTSKIGAVGTVRSVRLFKMVEVEIDDAVKTDITNAKKWWDTSKNGAFKYVNGAPIDNEVLHGSTIPPRDLLAFPLHHTTWCGGFIFLLALELVKKVYSQCNWQKDSEQENNKFSFSILVNLGFRSRCRDGEVKTERSLKDLSHGERSTRGMLLILPFCIGLLPTFHESGGIASL